VKTGSLRGLGGLLMRSWSGKHFLYINPFEQLDAGECDEACEGYPCQVF
jgi:hypothetical protein